MKILCNTGYSISSIDERAFTDDRHHVVIGKPNISK